MDITRITAEIESFVRITPDQADLVGRYLMQILDTEHSIVENLRSDFEEVSDALLALGNDTDAIICVGTDYNKAVLQLSKKEVVKS